MSIFLKNSNFYYVLFICIFLSSCFSTAELELVTEKQNNNNKKNDYKISIYFDKSASIGGYLTNGPSRGAEDDNFKNKIKTFMSYFQDKEFDKRFSIYLIADEKPQQYSPKITSSADLIRKFSDGMGSDWGLRNGNNTPLHTMFENIFEKDDSLSNNISILITESIMSYSDEKLKDDPYANQNRDDLKGNITRVFSRYEKNYGISCYAFYSKFDGTYFNYLNKNEACCLKNLRPFYIWVIGKKELMPQFTDYLMKDKKFKSRQELNFGWQYNLQKKGILSLNEGRKGEWGYVDSTKIEKISIGETTQLTVGLVLEGYPKNVQELQYLKENLEFNGDIVNKNSMKIRDKKSFIKETQAKASDLGKYTHFITFELNNNVINTLQTNKLTIKLKKENPTWHKEWTTDNDIDINSAKNNKKTFAFKELIEGIFEAYNKQEYYF